MHNDLDDIIKEKKHLEDQTEYNNNIENDSIIPNEDADSDGISDDFASVDDDGEQGYLILLQLHKM